MVITLNWNEKDYEANLAEPHNIAITLQNEMNRQPNAFGAPLYEAKPHRDGDFIGEISSGSPVNFFNIRLNPHGNGTHTECVGHILNGEYSINQSLSCSFAIAEVVSIFPTINEMGDKVITAESLSVLCCHHAEALVVRTFPNEADKRFRKYTGTNPAYFSEKAMRWIHDQEIVHLLTDLPSVDPEVDGGALNAHKMFWQTHKKPRTDRTITEMIYVDNSVKDGLYLLDIQIAPFALDVSPSRPILYRLKPI